MAMPLVVNNDLVKWLLDEHLIGSPDFSYGRHHLTEVPILNQPWGLDIFKSFKDPEDLWHLIVSNSEEEVEANPPGICTSYLYVVGQISVSVREMNLNGVSSIYYNFKTVAVEGA